jgi:hypothetical protein
VRVHVWTPTKLTADQERVLRELAAIESAPPTDGEAGRGLWTRLKEALGGE